MKRWTGFIPILGTIVRHDDGFSTIALPSHYVRGKTRTRIRVVLWPDKSQSLTPVVDGVSIFQPSYGATHGASPVASEYVTSTLAVHTGADKDNSATGRAERAADRVVLGNYPLPTAAGIHGNYIDTAVGCRAWITNAPFDLFTFGTVLCPKWEDNGGGWSSQQALFWLIATPHPNGGVSFVRMMDFSAGPYWGTERWFCDGPELMFAGQAPEGHKEVAFIYEGSEDVVPTPYGYLYLCEACRKRAQEEGRKDKGFGGDDSANRFLKLIVESGEDEQGNKTYGSCSISTYSSPATVSGRSYEFYYGHSPVHNTLVTSNPVGVLTGNGLEELAPIQVITDPGGIEEPITRTSGWSYSCGEYTFETWGRNYSPRGVALGQITTRCLANPNLRMYDPYFSEDRATPEMLESDFLAPRQLMDSKTTLNKNYPIGEWSLPPEVVYKWKTKPDPIFNESLPIDEPLGMRVYNLGLMKYKRQHQEGAIVLAPVSTLDTCWEILVEANHFYIGSDSSTLDTSKAKHKVDMLLIGQKELREAFSRAMLLGTVGGIAGMGAGIATIDNAINGLNLMRGNLAEHTYGVAGYGDNPTRYLRHQYDTEKRLYTLTLPNNAGDRETILPNNQKVYAEERRVESRFGCVPSISGYLDPRGEVAVVWPHSKRWMHSPNLVVQVGGVEQQYTIETYDEEVGKDKEGHSITKKKLSQGWAANPNRIHRVADMGIRNAQVSTDETERYVAVVWDQHLDNGHYVPYLQLVDKLGIFAPRGTLRTLNGGGKAFIPSEALDHFTHETGDGKANRGTGLTKSVESGRERINDPEMDRPQDWRHIYPLPIGKTQIVLLIGDKELICQYDSSTGEMNPVSVSNADNTSLTDDQVPVSHIFLRVLPFGLFSPRPLDKGKGMTSLLEAGVFRGPKHNSVSLGQGYNPTATFDGEDIHIFFNTMEEPGRVPTRHGGGFQEYEASIVAGGDLQLKLYGAEIRKSPAEDGTAPSVQCYLSLYPARTPVRHLRIPAASISRKINQCINPTLTNSINGSEAETNTVELMLEEQDELSDYLSRNTQDMGLLVARCGPPLTTNEFERANSKITDLYNTYTAENYLPDKETASQQQWDAYAKKLTDYVYKEMAGFQNMSRRQIEVFLYDKLTGTPSEDTALKLALRTYLGQKDEDVTCPKCGSYSLQCTEIEEGMHQIGTFSCSHCGHTFTEDCHYVELEYIDAAHDVSRSRTWVVGGVYDSNTSLGCDEGFLYLSSKVSGSGIWSGERILIPSNVSYQHIADEDPGPNAEKRKPYLWDTSDERNFSYGSALSATDKNPEVDKKTPPVEDGLKHISFVPPHKPKIIATKKGLVCIVLSRELYDADLAKKQNNEDGEEKTGEPGDHVASTASPSIPRVYYSRDGFLWDSDYSKVWKREAPEGDIYVQPKRDFWELPQDLKEKSGQG